MSLKRTKISPKVEGTGGKLDEWMSDEYKPPAQDKTRDLYHTWFQEAQEEGVGGHRGGDPGGDSGGAGLKSAMAEFENSWYVAAALAMTVGFAFMTLNPEGKNPGSIGDAVAKYAFLLLSLLATINSVLGVWWAGHMLPQVHWHPASRFSKFWFAALNTSMGHGQQFSKISLQQLVLALVPLCYLYYGLPGLFIALFSIGCELLVQTGPSLPSPLLILLCSLMSLITLISSSRHDTPATHVGFPHETYA